MDTNPIIMMLTIFNNGLIQPLFHLTLMFSVATGFLSYMIKPLRRVVMRIIRKPRVFLPLSAILGSGIGIEVVLGYVLG